MGTETIAAQDILHDIGTISMMSSDSMATGRCAEVWRRTFQTANEIKHQSGQLGEDDYYTDNQRVKRYVAKCTKNVAIIHGNSVDVGSVELSERLSCLSDSHQIQIPQKPSRVPRVRPPPALRPRTRPVLPLRCRAVIHEAA